MMGQRPLLCLAVCACARAAALAPYVVIAEPAQDSVVYGWRGDDASAAKNMRTVTLVLHYYDLPADNENASLWIRFDRGEGTRVGPPVSSALDVSLRYGTHFLEVALRLGARDGGDDPYDVPPDVDPASVASVVFDLAPEPGTPILRDADDPFGAAAADDAAAEVRPRGDAFEWGEAIAERLGRPVRVVLVGSLQLGGQSMLALEQARRLPAVALPDGSSAFDLTFASTAGSSRSRPTPLGPMLEALGVPVVRYTMEIPRALIDEYGEREAEYTPRVAAALAAVPSLDALPPLLAPVVGDLVAIFKGADVVSFTNHEAYYHTDALIVECARLAGVKNILNEPSNMWWGNLPTGADGGGIAGLVLPSGFAARFWASRGARVPLFVVPPGVALDAAAVPRARPPVGPISRVGFVSRLAPQKSPGLFVRAAAVVARAYRHAGATVRFVVVGDGPLREPLEALARRLNLRVVGGLGGDDPGGAGYDGEIEFAGWLAPEAVRGVVAAKLDVVVHANVLEETFCMCNVEAMAEGVPVVSFGVGGVSEYLPVDSDYGVVVKRPSVPALAAALLEFLEDGAAVAAYGGRAARRVRGLDGGADLSFERMARQYANLYGSLATEGAAGAPPPEIFESGDVVGDVERLACAEGGYDRAGWDRNWSPHPSANPARLLVDGDYWGAACGIVAHVGGQIADARVATAHGVEGIHALVLMLIRAVRFHDTNLTPLANSRDADALLAAARVAERIADKAADAVGCRNRTDALLNLAAVARVARGGTPDAAAADYARLLERRRGMVHGTRRRGGQALLLDLLGSPVPYTASAVDMEVEPSDPAAGYDGRTVRIAIGGLPLFNREEGQKRAFQATPGKLTHNARQLRYLASVPDLDLGADALETLRTAHPPGTAPETTRDLLLSVADAHEAVAGRLSRTRGLGDNETDVRSLLDLMEDTTADSERDDYQFLAVLACLDATLHVSRPPATAARAVAPLDADDLAAKFFADDYVVLDGALAPEALGGLYRQLVESTVWYDIKRGHLGVYLEDGLASGLLLQVADEFQRALGKIVARARLVQAWAYKYHGADADMGIRPHADEGAITVNCWLAPDDANAVPGSGGLRIFRANVPADMPFKQANQDFRRVRKHVEGAPRVEIEHRQNRCVVFRSKLVHETMPFFFSSDYDKLRINLSLMYGSEDWSGAWKNGGEHLDDRYKGGDDRHSSETRATWSRANSQQI